MPRLRAHPSGALRLTFGLEANAIATPAGSVAVTAPSRILFISSLFPPDVHGGAEATAGVMAHHLAARGQVCGVLTTAKRPSEEVAGVMVDGLQLWRVTMPRAYPTFRFPTAPNWQKPLWHLQDHLDPRNRRIVGRVLDEFRPDFVVIHMLQGIGYNALAEIAGRDIPTVYLLHDLGLACIRMSMFRDGKECPGLCPECRVSRNFKAGLIHRFRRIGFCSPSRSNLQQLSKFFPLGGYPTAAILNPNRYPPPIMPRTRSDTVRLLYVGRLHSAKGVHLLLAAAAMLADRYAFHLTIIGAGPAERELKNQYAQASWCRFTGFISQEEISDAMVNSDLMCVPSVWMENSPGVIVHALGLGLPVIGSDKGGIPELVQDRVNGRLVKPGDVGAWTQALEEILRDPAQLEDWRRNAIVRAPEFEQDALATKFLQFMRSIAE